jgi:MOSC domain-containing protein YiiM
MHVVSVNVGMPKTVDWRGRKVTTAIFKEPVEGRVRIRRTGLAGDRQGDLSVHGGPKKAVYAYPSEHYPFWRRELERAELPWGSFGENLTTEGLQEDTVHIGDHLRVGSALLRVTQPRMPCYKLGIRFARDDMIQRFLANGRSGFYLAVLTEGDVAAGDRLEVAHAEEGLPTVSEVVDEARREEPGG